MITTIVRGASTDVKNLKRSWEHLWQRPCANTTSISVAKIQPLRPDAERLTVEITCDHLELLEVCQSAPFRRNSTSELVGVSPERVAKLYADHGLKPGCSLDLTNGYDFDTIADRRKAWDIVKRDLPLLFIWSPPMHLLLRPERAQQIIEPEQSDLDATIRG